MNLFSLMPSPLWQGRSSPMAFPFAAACSQQVPEELSKTRVLRLVGLGLSESTAWETSLSRAGTFCFHRRSERRKSRSLVRCSMTTWGIWSWRNKGVWISNSEQIKKTVLENGSVFIDIPHNTRIMSLHSAVGDTGTSIS